MLFEFNVKISDEDYFEFNKFHMIKSHYGRSQMLKIRLMIAAIFVLAILVFGMGDGLSSYTLVYAVPCLIALVLFQIFFNKFMAASLRSHIKSLKKKGKMGYSPESVLQFYDDVLVETTPTEKNERSYSTLERVSIVGDETVYIHFNNIMACILPRASFESDEQYKAFLEFIKTKCDNIDVY